MKTLKSKAYLILLSILICNFSFAQQLKIEQLEKVLKEQKKDKKSEEILYTLIKIGDFYKESEDYEKAIKYYTKSIEISQNSKNYKGIVIAQNKIGIAYLNYNEYKNALSNFKSALNLAKANKFTNFINDINSNIAIVNDKIIRQKIANEKYEKLKSLNKENALQLIEQENNKQKKENEIFLRRIKALGVNNQMIELSLKFKEHEIEKKRLEINLLNKYNELKTIEIAKNKVELEKKNIESQKQKIIIGVSIVGLLFLILLVFFIYKGYRQKRKTNELLIANNKIIEKKNREILDSILCAKNIQKSLLFHQDEFSENFTDAFILYLPKDIVSGDFYWNTKVKELGEDSTIVVLADCIGHGVSGAFITIVVRFFLEHIINVQKEYNPSKILTELNRSIIEYFSEIQEVGLDITLCRIFPNQNKILVASAMQKFSLFSQDRGFEVYRGDVFSIGEDSLYNKAIAFENKEILYKNGDILYLYSDGFADQFGGEKNLKFMESKFNNLLQSVVHENMVEQQQLILDAFNSWKKFEKQIDDVLILGLKL